MIASINTNFTLQTPHLITTLMKESVGSVVLEILKEATGAVSAGDIARRVKARLGTGGDTVRSTLSRMRDRGEIVSPERGYYRALTDAERSSGVLQKGVATPDFRGDLSQMEGLIQSIRIMCHECDGKPETKYKCGMLLYGILDEVGKLNDAPGFKKQITEIKENLMEDTLGGTDAQNPV